MNYEDSYYQPNFNSVSNEKKVRLRQRNYKHLKTQKLIKNFWKQIPSKSRKPQAMTTNYW